MSVDADTGTRLVITAATLAYGVGPFLIDLNRTHLLHPAWPGHARFHLLWSVASQFLVSAIALWLVWAGGSRGDCRLAAGIGLAMNSGFWAAFIFRRAYRGTLHDPQGIPPIGGKVDGNLVAVTVITLMLLVGFARSS